MERNFFRRIELAFPVIDAKLKRRVIAEGLKCYLADNQNSWEMDGRGQLPAAVSPRPNPGAPRPN